MFKCRHPHLNDEQHIAIAHTVLAVSRLEWQIANLVNDLMHSKPEDERKAVLPGLQGKKLVKEAKRRLTEAFPDKTDQIDALFKEIVAVQKQRHDITHSIWGPSHLENVSVYTRALPYNDDAVRLAEAKDIRIVGNRAQDLASDVRNLREFVFNKLIRR